MSIVWHALKHMPDSVCHTGFELTHHNHEAKCLHVMEGYSNAFQVTGNMLLKSADVNDCMVLSIATDLSRTYSSQ